jgi:serine/threonine protein kinase HipA of HipAB toxin-antitoxin module
MADHPSSAHLTHDELDSVSLQREDCAAVGRNLRLERIARAAVAGAPSLQYADFPREIAKRDIPVSEAAARIANALHLHLA